MKLFSFPFFSLIITVLSVSFSYTSYAADRDASSVINSNINQDLRTNEPSRNNKSLEQDRHPFPIMSDEEDLQSLIIDDYNQRNNLRSARIGDEFVLYDDMYDFLDMLPHKTEENVTHKSIAHYNDVILSRRDDNFENDMKLMDQYYMTYRRVLAPTMKER